MSKGGREGGREGGRDNCSINSTLLHKCDRLCINHSFTAFTRITFNFYFSLAKFMLIIVVFSCFYSSYASKITGA